MEGENRKYISKEKMHHENDQSKVSVLGLFFFEIYEEFSEKG